MEKALLEMKGDGELDMEDATKAYEEIKAEGGEVPDAPEAEDKPSQANEAAEDHAEQEEQQEPPGEITVAGMAAAMAGAAAEGERDLGSSAEFSRKTSSRQSGRTDLLQEVAQ